MPEDPMEEWRRLTTLYNEMGDIEISELADQINDLTPNAQQILREELKKRGIGERQSPQAALRHNSDMAAVHWGAIEGAEDDTSDSATADYTWKTALCRCDSIDEAAQRCEMLRRAGIDTWVQRPGSRFSIPWVDELGTGEFQINVAADQLEEARAIVSQPIPQDIIDQVREEISTAAYEIPVCPKCKAEDPILESVEPSNNWLCESCGYTWSDPADPSPLPETAANR